MGESLAIAALVLFSINIIVTKLGSARLDMSLGFLIAMVVNVLFAALIVVAQLALREEILSLNFTSLLLFALAGFFSTYLGRWLLYDSVLRLGPSRASAFQSSNPMFTVLIAWVVLDERLDGLDLIASAAILVGLFLTSQRPAEHTLESESQKEGSLEAEPQLRHLFVTLLSSGGLLALLGAFSYAVGNVLRGVAVEDWNEPVLGVLVGALTGLLAYSTLYTGCRNIGDRVLRADRRGLRLFALSGTLTVIAQACMVGAMRYSPVSIVTLITLSTPVLVLPVGYFVLNNAERVAPSTVLGTLAILLGIAVILVT